MFTRNWMAAELSPLLMLTYTYFHSVADKEISTCNRHSSLYDPGLSYLTVIGILCHFYKKIWMYPIRFLHHLGLTMLVPSFPSFLMCSVLLENTSLQPTSTTDAKGKRLIVL